MACAWHFLTVYSKNFSCVLFIHKSNSFLNSSSHLSMLEINSASRRSNSEMSNTPHTHLALNFCLSQVHRALHTCRDTPGPRPHGMHSPSARRHSLFRTVFALHLYCSFYKIWSNTVCKQHQTSQTGHLWPCFLQTDRGRHWSPGTHLQTSAHGHTLIPHQSTKQPSACLHLHKLQNVAKISFTSRHVICKVVYAREEVPRQPQPQIPAIKARAFSKTRRWYPTYPHVNAEELPYAVSQCGWFGIGAARLPHKHSPPSAQQSCSSTARSAAAQSTGCSAGTEAAPTRQRLHMRQTKNNYGSWEAGRDPSGAAINSTKRLPEPQWIQQWNPPHQESALNFIVLKLHCTSKAKFNKSSTFWQKLTNMEQVPPNSP